MPLKLGTTNIGAIYKGTTPIVAIYKGTQLVFSSYTWQDLFLENIYKSLIPTTVNSKETLNKAKVSKIYGNSVVENQLANPNQSNSQNGITLTNNNDGSITLTGIASANAYLSFQSVNLKTNANEKYLIFGCHKNIAGVKVGFDGSTTYWCDLEGEIKTITTTQTSVLRIRVLSGTDLSTPITLYPQVVDLTQRYPFNTTTILTDNRVQAILNRGYIPFNSGEIKSVDIGEFSTTKADTTALATLPFKYQGGGVGTSHDTMEITSSGYVFTKDRALVNFETQTWVNSSGNIWHNSVQLDTPYISGSTKPNALCNTYIIDTYTNVNNSTTNKTVSIRGDDRLVYVYDTGITQASDITGTLEYQLATPQVITIPRKHLGVVDLGSFTYIKSYYAVISISNTALTNIKPAPSNTSIANIYCFKYRTSTKGNVQYIVSDMTIAISTSGQVFIQDSNFNNLTTAQIKQALNGIYLFYETQDEVADITDTIDIQAGGTITTNSNVLPNADLDIKCKR